MYYNMNTEELEIAKRLTELDIKNRKFIETLFPQIEETVKKFDNKILNKRLETALKDINKQIYIKRSDYNYQINYFCDDDMVKGAGYLAYYSKNREVTMAWCNTYDNNYQKGFLNEEKINAKELIEMIEKNKKGFIEETENMTISLSIIDNKIAEYKDLISKCDAFNRSLDSTVKDYYNIKDINNY